MGNSLRDAFLKAGLVANQSKPASTPDQNHRNQHHTNKNDNNQDRRNSSKNKHRSNNKNKVKDKDKIKDNTAVIVGTKRFKPTTSAKSAPVKNQYSQSDRDARTKALDVRIRTLIDQHKLNLDSAEIEFNFERGGRIKRVYVTDQQRDELQAGNLVIVGFEGCHYLVPLVIGTEVRDIRSDIFVYSITYPECDNNGSEIPSPESDDTT